MWGIYVWTYYTVHPLRQDEAGGGPALCSSVEHSSRRSQEAASVVLQLGFQPVAKSSAATFLVLVQAARLFFGLALLAKLRFVKKAGGSSADMAPVGAQLVMVKSPTANADARLSTVADTPKLVFFSLQARQRTCGAGRSCRLPIHSW